MMNSQGWPAVLPHHPFWSTTFARDLRRGGVCFVREVIALVFALWKRKEENEKELDVITRPSHPSRCRWALHLLTNRVRLTHPQQTPEAGVLQSVRAFPFCAFSRRDTHTPDGDCVSRRAELGTSPEARPSYALGTEGNKD